eukprot:TRINITY_DN181_c0_g1_i1.p1 TRINITY_DN181_c0_g1~~TRINITY_DN181_c0_g1_i1.p1  ORF type:complete len:638 (-),score=227.90 TRINITY_DN181_c0_g1_i1:153-2066(-)
MMPFAFEDDSFEDTRSFMARGGESPSAFTGGPHESPTFMMPRGQSFQSSSRGRRAPQASPTFMDSPAVPIQRAQSFTCSRKLCMSPDDSDLFLNPDGFGFPARQQPAPVVLHNPYLMGPRENAREAPAFEEKAQSMEDDDLTDPDEENVEFEDDEEDDEGMRTNEQELPVQQQQQPQEQVFRVPAHLPAQRSFSVSHINTNNRGLASSGGYFGIENFNPSNTSPSSFKVPSLPPLSSRHESLSASAPPCSQSPPLGYSIMDQSQSPQGLSMATSQKRRTLLENSFPASSNLHQTYLAPTASSSSSSSCSSPSSMSVHEDPNLVAQHRALRQMQRDQQKEGHRARTLSASTNHLNTQRSAPSSFAMSPSSLSRPAATAAAENEEPQEAQDSRFGGLKKKTKMVLVRKAAASSSVFPPPQCVPLAETARSHFNSFSGIAPGRRDAHDLILPIDWNSSHSNVISADTMHRVMRGEFNGQMSELIVIDCRYPYEYQGGHIKGAINCSPWNIPLLINQRLFTHNITREMTDNVVIILHCEFSQRRAPKTHTILREVSRRVFGARVDASCYHNCYVLGGGFKNYHAQYKEDCNGVYVPELQPEFCNLQTQCKREDKLFFRRLESQPNKTRYLVDPDRHLYFGL